jgi:hypothetical protein
MSGQILDDRKISFEVGREVSLEKGKSNAQLDAHKVFAKEVYRDTVGIDKVTGEPKPLGKIAMWGLFLRERAGRLGAEEGGIERVPSELRTNLSPIDMFTLYMGANVCTATLGFGTLGLGLFKLGWWDLFLSLLFFNLIGTIPPSYIVTLGPKLGPRTIVISRFSFGWWPSKLLALLNGVNIIGRAIVNTIAGAVILYDVGQEKLPLSVAVLILCF